MLENPHEPPKGENEPSWDPGSVSDIGFALWCCLMAHCDTCEQKMELDDIDDYPSPIEWSEAMAPQVKAAGWSAPEEFKLLCSQCTTKLNVAASAKNS